MREFAIEPAKKPKEAWAVHYPLHVHERDLLECGGNLERLKRHDIAGRYPDAVGCKAQVLRRRSGRSLWAAGRHASSTPQLLERHRSLPEEGVPERCTSAGGRAAQPHPLMAASGTLLATAATPNLRTSPPSRDDFQQAAIRRRSESALRRHTTV